MNGRDYVLVTPARNEEAYIGATIQSVAAQTILPRKWIIVSDGSVDRTDAIVESYTRKHDFIELLRAGQRAALGQRDFGAKVRAFNAGYALVSGTPHEFVGNLDADVTFAPGYFAQLLDNFECDPKLGLGGGLVHEPLKSGFVPQQMSMNSVCGSVQLFRRSCYESIGGYVPLRLGGVDAAAEIMARMHGWGVQTFPDIPVYAQRRVLTGGTTVLHTRFRQGAANYMLGYHPLFQMASCVCRIHREPFLLGSILTLFGYWRAALRGNRRELPSEVIHFLRSEQISRLAGFFESASANRVLREQGRD
jgi:biofilm PGA synthesis N-glycosyltransferase PgaC